MGLFSSKKVYVSSTVRNLAGEFAERPDYLKTVIAANNLSSSRSMPEVLKESYLYGPGMKLRSFYRWATYDDGSGPRYADIGLPQATLYQGGSVPAAALAAQTAAIVGYSLYVKDVDRGPGDFSYWAEQYMWLNYPDEVETDWTNDYNPTTNKITITRPGKSTVTFSPVNYDPDSNYLYISHKRPGFLAPHGIRMLIYKVGSGNAVLDSYFQTAPFLGDFFPFIPIRLNNAFLSTSYYPDAYALAKKAYKKAFGRDDYDSLIAKIGEAESLADIDHCYAVFGPSLNTPSQASLNYIWEFFNLMYNQALGSGNTTITNTSVFSNYYNENQSAAGEDLDVSTADLSQVPQESLRISDNNALPGKFDMEIAWKAASRFTGGVGLGKPGALPGDVWWTTGSTWNTAIISRPSVNRSFHDTTIYKQTSANTWSSISFTDLKHTNTIYKKKSVEITAKEALNDPEDSGFIIPLQYDALKNTGLIDGTQLSLECCNLVFNSYKVVKTGLLGSLFFNFLLSVIITVIVTVVFPPAGAATAATTFAASIGITGLAAIIVNAAVSVLAGMLISAIVSPVAKSLFGEKIGSLLGSIATFVALSATGSFLGGNGFAVNFSQLSTAQMLISLTSAAANAYSSYVAADTAGIIKKTEKLEQEAEAKLKEVQQLYAENIGYGNGVIDPLMLLGANNTLMEPSSMFLHRTLLTGSDIAEMTLAMLSNFTDLSLQNSLQGIEQ